MSVHRSPVLILMLACAGAARPALAQATFRGIGIPQGGVSSFASGVSADGSIVVGTAVDSGSNFRAWRWTQSTGPVLLPFLANDNACEADAVTPDGATIVGASVFQQLDGSQACSWTDQGVTVTGLGDLPGGDFYSTASGVSASGVVVVGTGSSAASASEAFRGQGGIKVGLGALPGGEWSEAWGVSADGSVVVGTSENGNFDFEAFRWSQATGMIGLGIPADALENYAAAASADGSVVVGYSFTLNTFGSSRAFRWTAATGRQDLPDPPGYIGSDMLAVNADGSAIVGSLYNQFNQPVGMIWDAPHGPRLMQAVLTEAGADLTGWTLHEVTAISPDGRAFAGNGTNPQGEADAWVATLPASTCYANCDQSTAAPVLNVLDFNCFLNRYTAGDPYANCDGSTQPPTLNILDFNCFLNRFTGGCP